MLVGGDGNDALNGGQGDDRLEGNAGDDRLVGNDGADTLVGQEGRDRLNARDTGGSPTPSTGPGARRVLLRRHRRAPVARRPGLLTRPGGLPWHAHPVPA